MAKEIDIGAYSAYAIAVKHGYEGTEAEFAAQLMNSAANGALAQDGAERAEAAAAEAAETLDSIPEDYTELTGEVGQLSEEIGMPVRFTASDFVQGYTQIQNGIVANDYAITTDQLKSIAVGDKLVVDPNGLKVTLRILNSSDVTSSSTTTYKGFTNLTEYTEYISEFAGFVQMDVRKVDSQRITPADYACDVGIGETRIDVLKKKVQEIKLDVDQFPRMAASPRYKPFTRIINNCQTASDWAITNNDNTLVSVDMENYILGSQSLRCDNQMRSIKHTYDLNNNDLVIKLRINSISSGASLQVRIGHKAGGGVLVYEIARGTTWTTPKDWVEVVIPRTGYSYGNADLDFNAIDSITVIVVQGTADWNLQYVGMRSKTLNKGIVTFTFDDGYKSQYTGIKALAEKGITGTIFHIVPANDQALSTSELQELVNFYGADIEAHGDPAFITDTVPESERGGFSAAWTEDSLKAYWENMQNYLRENGLSEGKHMAYPNGMYPDRVVQLAKAYFDSCRTIIPFIPVESYPPADRHRIRAVSGISANGITVDAVKTYIDKAIEANAWLILVFHKIGEGTGDSMDCSLDDLKAIADYAIESGAYIMNYAEAFENVYSRGL